MREDSNAEETILQYGGG